MDDPDLQRDAERWRALMASGRMHFMGSSGIDLEPMPGTRGHETQFCEPKPRPGKTWHFGMEFWSTHPAAGDPQYPDRLERKLMVAYADAMRGLAALIKENKAANFSDPETKALYDREVQQRIDEFGMSPDQAEMLVAALMIDPKHEGKAMVDTKFKKAELPPNATVAIQMAEEREEWAVEARKRDQNGSAREFELTALLLRAWVPR
jgi:hypothetical protein